LPCNMAINRSRDVMIVPLYSFLDVPE
jgi:hypothetical protein